MKRDNEISDRRNEILNVAQALFVERGIDRVSTREIAARVGIRQPSLYAHFPTKADLLAQVCLRAFKDLEVALDKAGHAEGSPQERLRVLFGAYIDFGINHPSAYRIAFMERMPDIPSKSQHSVLEAGIGAFSVLQDVVGKIVSDPTKARLTAESLWCSLHGLVSLLIIRDEFPWHDRYSFVEHHIERLLGSANSSN